MLALVLGCSVPEDGAAALPIVGGTDSDASDDAVVLVLHVDDASGPATCTGTLIAPDLVLTARHCVAIAEPTVECNPDGTAATGGRIGADYDPETLFAFAGATRPDLSSGGTRGAELFTDGAENLCDHDIALLRLEAPIEGAPIAPLRLGSRPEVGEAVSLVGWGASETSMSPEARQRRSGSVLELGPGERMSPTELRIGEGACAGDSGGPALAESTGAILGVVSRSATPGDPPEACVGATNIYTGVADHEALILEALASVDQDPWREGEPNPLSPGCAVSHTRSGHLALLVLAVFLRARTKKPREISGLFHGTDGTRRASSSESSSGTSRSHRPDDPGSRPENATRAVLGMQSVTLSPRTRVALMRAIETARAAGRSNDADALASLLAALGGA